MHNARAPCRAPCPISHIHAPAQCQVKQAAGSHSPPQAPLTVCRPLQAAATLSCAGIRKRMSATLRASRQARTYGRRGQEAWPQRRPRCPPRTGSRLETTGTATAGAPCGWMNGAIGASQQSTCCGLSRGQRWPCVRPQPAGLRAAGRLLAAPPSSDAMTIVGPLEAVLRADKAVEHLEQSVVEHDHERAHAGA